MSTLGAAVKLASLGHINQVNKKSGEAYILHPIRVMNNLETEEEKIVGILHDVLEDTVFTEEDLFTYGFSEEIIEAVKSVTKNDGEEYFDFIARVKQNEIGRKVKLADLKDNMDWSRISNPTQKDLDRMIKYQKAYYMLVI